MLLDAQLCVTTDFGVTWTSKLNHVTLADWGLAGTQGIPDGNMFALYREKPLENPTFVRTLDMFDTSPTYTLDNALFFMHFKEITFIVRVRSPGVMFCSVPYPCKMEISMLSAMQASTVNRSLELWSSVDGGEVFTRALFPNRESLVEKVAESYQSIIALTQIVCDIALHNCRPRRG